MSLPLVFNKPEEYPIIGKFEDKVEFSSAIKPIRMYFKDEEIIEEPVDEGAKKDSEYYKRKRQRRKSLRSQSNLVIEDSTPRNPRGGLRGLQFTGKLTNLNLSDTNMAAPFQPKSKSTSTSEAPFKYVILQPQKLVIDGREQTQIIVTPVKDWYTFKKPSIGGQKLLDEIDDEYDIKLQRDKAKLSRYNKMLSIGKDVSDSGGNEPEEEENETQGSSAFLLPSVFGRNASSSKAKGRKGMASKILNGSVDVTKTGLTTETLVDLDAAADMDEYTGGDYTKNFADDDEEIIDTEQVLLDSKAEYVAGQEIVPEPDLVYDKDGKVIGENEDADEDDEDKFSEASEEEYEDSSYGATGSSSGGVGGVSKSSSGTDAGGMVDADMERGAREYGRKLAELQNANAMIVEEPVVSMDSSLLAGKKRQRDSPVDEAMAAQSTVSTEAKPQKPTESDIVIQSGATVESTSTSSLKQTAAGVIELTESSVIAYIRSYGGKVPLDALKEEFKKKVAQYNKQHKKADGSDDKPGNKLFLDIIKRVSIIEVDPLGGKVVKLIRS